MAKKSFRPQKSSSPSYPILREVDRGTVRRWGMVGLMLGGAACTPAKAELPPPGEPPLQRVESKPSPKPDASPDTDTIETVKVTLGKPRAPRVEEPKRKPAKGEKAKSPDKKGDSKAKTGAAKDASSKGNQAPSAEPQALPREPGLRGKIRMPRVEEESKGFK
jgi:hypothetical protein